MIKEKWTKWIPIFIGAVLLIVFYKTLDSFPSIVEEIGKFIKIISPFLYGILIVYFLYIPCKKLEELYLNSKVKWIREEARLLSVLSVFLILLLVLVFVITFILPILINSIVDLANNVPIYFRNIVDYVDSITHNANIRDSLQNFVNNTINDFFNPTRVETLTKSVIGIATGILNIILSLVSALYILLERDKIVGFFEKLSNALFKDKVRTRLNNYLKEVNKVVFTFIASKGLDSIINIVVITSILLIFNVKFALLLGFMAGIFNFIPYLGVLIGVMIITVITLLTGGLSQAITVVIFLLIFQQIDGNIIEPKIMGTNLKISPLLVIIAVVVGGAYFGIMGMFLAVPIVTVLKQILLEYMDYRTKE